MFIVFLWDGIQSYRCSWYSTGAISIRDMHGIPQAGGRFFFDRYLLFLQGRQESINKYRLNKEYSWTAKTDGVNIALCTWSCLHQEGGEDWVTEGEPRSYLKQVGRRELGR